MGAVWARLRSEARARWWSWAALALVAGIAAAAVLSAQVAASLGVPSEPTTSVVALVVAILGILLLANLAAVVPAWLARRTRPATVLRTE